MAKKSMYIAESSLDDDQRAVINSRVEESCYVSGCAGSGKSCLALLKMKMLGERNLGTFMYVTFVRELVEFVRRELRMNSVSDDSIYTFEEWKKGETMRSFHSGATKKIEGEQDYILVDECQDLSYESLQRLYKSQRKGFFLYGDDKQQLYSFLNQCDTKITSEHLARFGLKGYQLRNNYRLPKGVAKFAQNISGDEYLYKHCKSPRESIPYVLEHLSIREQIDLICNLIQSSPTDFEDVAILCKSNEQCKDLYHQLVQMLSSRGIGQRVSASYSLKTEEGVKRKIGEHFSNLGDTPLKIMTMHKAKGQEFEKVFILVEGNEYETVEPNMMYVALTRTYGDVYVLCEDQMPVLFQSIPVSLYKTSLVSSQLELV